MIKTSNKVFQYPITQTEETDAFSTKTRFLSGQQTFNLSRFETLRRGFGTYLNANKTTLSDFLQLTSFNVITVKTTGGVNEPFEKKCFVQYHSIRS